MSEIPGDLKFLKSYEWARVEGDGKITVLAAIILFLQWRPAGMFVTRSRNLEG